MRVVRIPYIDIVARCGHAMSVQGSQRSDETRKRQCFLGTSNACVCVFAEDNCTLSALLSTGLNKKPNVRSTVEHQGYHPPIKFVLPYPPFHASTHDKSLSVLFRELAHSLERGRATSGLRPRHEVDHRNACRTCRQGLVHSTVGWHINRRTNNRAVLSSV